MTAHDLEQSFSSNTTVNRMTFVHSD